MPTVLTEETCTGTLEFEFSDKWQVYKYDEQVKGNFYEDIKNPNQGLKAVDFIAVSKKSVLLIEVKNIIADDENCRMRLSKETDDDAIKDVLKQLQVNEELASLETGRITVISKRPYLAEEVAKKAKDTVLGLLASYYQSDEKLSPFHQAIFVDKKPIFLILFLERTDELNQENRFKPLASNLKLVIGQKTEFLCAGGIDVINSLTLPDALGIKVSKI